MAKLAKGQAKVPLVETRRMALAELLPADYNPRRINDKAMKGLRASLERFGELGGIVYNEQTGRLVGGHQRVKALAALGVVDAEVRVVSIPIAEEKAANLALNHPGIGGEWDEGMLAAVLADVQRDLPTAFDELQLGDLWAEADAAIEQGEVDEDDVPEPPERAVSQRGDLWVMGEHRVLCGDSTNAEDVARLMDGAKADVCFTSPPYGQQRDYTKEGKEKCRDWDALMRGVFANLPMAEGGQVLVNLGMIHNDGEWLPYWDGWIAWMREQGWRRFGWYVWDQGPGMPGDWSGRLAPSHEFIWHFNRKSVGPKKARECKHAGEAHGGKGQRGVDGNVKKRSAGVAPVQSHAIHDSVLRVNRQGAMHGADGHPAPYPVGLPLIALQSWPGVAYEPFCGSGTTLIAAERMGSKCYGMEIGQQYCDIIVKRWQAFTGKDATLDGDGRTFAQVQEARHGATN